MDPGGYVRDLVAVVVAEGVDVVVPVIDEPGLAQPTADAVPARAEHCAVPANDPGTHRLLNDKASFAEPGRMGMGHFQLGRAG